MDKIAFLVIKVDVIKVNGIKVDVEVDWIKVEATEISFD